MLALIKYCTNNDFNTATIGAKFQHIIEAINIPEAYGDWDTDHSLDLKGHLKKDMGRGEYSSTRRLPTHGHRGGPRQSQDVVEAQPVTRKDS